AKLRWNSRRAARASAIRATMEAASPAPGPRRPGSLRLAGSKARAASVAAVASSSALPRRCTSRATARERRPGSRWCRPNRAAVRLASVPLPDAAGPSMAVIMAALPAGKRPSLLLRALHHRLSGCTGGWARAKMETPSAPPLWHADSGTKPFHQGTEFGKAGVDRVGVVDRDWAVGAKPQREKGHGDAVVEVGGHGAAARHANAQAGPGHGQHVPLDLGGYAAGHEPGSRGKQAVALLHLELGKPLHTRFALRVGGEAGQHRILVD